MAKSSVGGGGGGERATIPKDLQQFHSYHFLDPGGVERRET